MKKQFLIAISLALTLNVRAATGLIVDTYKFGGIPVTSGLLIQSDSLDFDAIADTTALTTWLDHSGNGKTWALWGGPAMSIINQGSRTITAPTVDQTIKANGHATIKFVGGATPQLLQQSIFFGASGFTGLEVMCVFRRNADPPAVSEAAGTPFQFIHPLSTFPNHVPFTDGNVYEGMALTTRPNFGNPTTSMSSAFRMYDVAAAQDGTAYDIWIDTENFVHLTTGYTFSQQREEAVFHNEFSLLYYVGFGTDYGGIGYPYAGNVACVYVWNRRLTSGERALMRTFLNTRYGTSS